MRRKKNHIALFILVLLSIFITPLVVKGVHNHTGYNYLHETEPGIFVSAYQSPCLVCNYEIVSFTITPFENVSVNFFFISTINTEIYTVDSKTAFFCFSHRGPPTIS